MTEKLEELKKKLQQQVDLFNQKNQEIVLLKEEILRLDGAVRELTLIAKEAEEIKE